LNALKKLSSGYSTYKTKPTSHELNTVVLPTIYPYNIMPLIYISL